MISIITKSPDETKDVGIRLSNILQPGSVVGLTGELGTGKTIIVQGIAYGLGIKDDITSPTFVIMREYRDGRLPLYHFDFYRLETSEEINDIGIEEYLAGEGICVIEWAEKIGYLLPQEYLNIKLQWKGETERIICLIPYGECYKNMITNFCKKSWIDTD
jgi:tRNA threonylcarbamoyladenosine biosynthesis protein TsaE